MLEVVDDRGRLLRFSGAPRRVVSLVPSDTFNVAAIGCGESIVGCTDYCNHPAELLAGVPKIGGTKNPRVADILDLKPDLVLANQEENSKGDLEALAQAGVRVLVAFPKRVAEGLSHLARLARIFQVERDAAVRALVGEGYGELRSLESYVAECRAVATFCPIWADPWMTIHGDTFMSDALRVAGARNVFADRERRYPLAADLGRAPARSGAVVEGRDTRYPRVTLEEVCARAPELVLLPDEPHPFSAGDAETLGALDIPAARFGNIVAIAGRDVCWPGAQSIGALTRLRAVVDAARARIS